MKRSTVETAAGVSLLAGALLGCASGAVTGMWGAGRDTIAFIKTYRNKAVARLKGDRGTSMLCRFDLDARGAGMGGGGTGECQTSRGAKVSAQF